MEESLFIHNIRDMKVLHTIRETPPNKNGLCALSIDSDHCYLAYPGHSSVGELQIFDALHLVSFNRDLVRNLRPCVFALFFCIYLPEMNQY